MHIFYVRLVYFVIFYTIPIYSYDESYDSYIGDAVGVEVHMFATNSSINLVSEFILSY